MPIFSAATGAVSEAKQNMNVLSWISLNPHSRIRVLFA